MVGLGGFYCLVDWMLDGLFLEIEHVRRSEEVGGFIYFGGLLEKHLFLGRTLLLRLQGYQTCAGAGMLAPGLANAVLVQHLVLIGRVDVGRLVGW